MKTSSFTHPVLIIYVFLITNYISLNSQNQFQRTIGGTANDNAYSIIQATDGGFAIAGYTNSYGTGNGDMYIVKLNSGGTLQWSRTIGGPDMDLSYSIVLTSDGGYAAAGWTGSFGAGKIDFFIIKLDANGTLQWSRTIGGTDIEYAYSIIQTTDGGFAIAGVTKSFGAGDADLLIVKLNSIGSLQWNRTIGGIGIDYAYSIIQTEDRGYAIAGYTDSYGAGFEDFYIVKLDSIGTPQWSRTIGGAGTDYAYSVVRTTDGGYAAAGYTNSFGAGSADMYIVKLSAAGMLQWSKTIGGAGADFAYSIIQTSDGGYAAAGYSDSSGTGASDSYIIKLNASGTLQWSRVFGGTGIDYSHSIRQITNEGYITAGATNSFGNGIVDFYIVKLDAAGNICGNFSSSRNTTGTGGSTTSPSSSVASSNSVVMTPVSAAGTGGTVTTICTFVGINPVSNEIPAFCKLSQNYPNPFNPNTQIEFSISKDNTYVNLEVYDVLGKKVAELVNENLKAGIYKVDFNGENLPSGVYIYKLEAEGFIQSRRMIILK